MVLKSPFVWADWEKQADSGFRASLLNVLGFNLLRSVYLFLPIPVAAQVVRFPTSKVLRRWSGLRMQIFQQSKSKLYPIFVLLEKR